MQALAWLNDLRADSDLSVKATTLDACNGWDFNAEGLSHASGHFFHIRGLVVRSNHAAWDGLIQPMIDQPEVGILAFFVRADGNGSVEWLLQAKTEPGTVDGTQIAPSVQATFSNYLRVHGGKETRFIDLVTNGANVITDRPHSEQGSRFLWKFNRNAVFALSADEGPAGNEESSFRWFSARELRHALGLEYVVNTDSRSVIASTDWSLLVAGRQCLFRSNCLHKSYLSRPDMACLSLLKRFSNQRKTRWEFTSLDKMMGWEWNQKGLVSLDSNEQAVGFFDISLSDREVSTWCQPLVMEQPVHECILLMRIRSGVAQFWVRAVSEVGFGNRTEFGPSMQNGIGESHQLKSLIDDDGATELVSIMQSDEGSRFMKVLVRYRIVLIPHTDIKNNLSQGVLGAWVNLNTLQSLSNRAATTNNELRSMVSLLLSQQFDDSVSAL